jgi:hypothetical protein
MILWLSDARGVYIPRDFALSFNDRDACVKGVTAEGWAILEAGPEHEQYWDAWAEIMDNAEVTDNKGVKYFIEQSGDCWLVPVGMEWDEDNETYRWPDEAEIHD